MSTRVEYLRKARKKTLRQMAEIKKLLDQQRAAYDQLQEKLTELDQELRREIER